MKTVLIVLLALMLTACPSTPIKVPQKVVIVPEKEKVVIAKSLRQKCTALPQMEARPYTEAETVAQMKLWFNQYDKCATSHNALIDIVDKAFNLSEN